MEYRLLGSIEVLDARTSLPLGGAKQRALLGLLLLNANKVVSVDRIVDELWGENPPETSANAVQVYVANLRKILQPDRPQGGAHDVLLTRPPGYMLRVDPEELDSLRFERLADDARRTMAAAPEAATAKLREALALWHGPALADIVFEGPARGEITRLEESRLSAIEDRIQGDLELGRHAALIGELESLIAAHPVRERLHAQLMLALYRCGRQAEALKAYRDARRMLVEELGIDPCAELQSLEKAILQQDPSLAAPVRAETSPAVGVPAPEVAEAAVTETVPPVEPALPDHAPVAEPPPVAVPEPKAPLQWTPSPQPAAPSEPEPVAASVSEVDAVGGRPRWRLRLLIAGAAVLVLGSFGGAFIFHGKSSGSPQAAVPPATTSTSPTPTPGPPFPTAAEQSLMALFPPFVEQCHRYAYYSKAIAGVECKVSPGHPGATTIVYEQFANFGDLELHFHHQQFLHTPTLGLKVSPLLCANDPNFFSQANYPDPTGAQAQPLQTAAGHLLCYLDDKLVPRVAWTNIGWLVVGQATGDSSLGTAAQAQGHLLIFWSLAGPQGEPAPDPSATTPELQIAELYHRYLQREPEPDGLQYWLQRLPVVGYAEASDEFARSPEAKSRFTLPILPH
jgi:DNA-binding SARP family transcriptional activator